MLLKNMKLKEATLFNEVILYSTSRAQASDRDEVELSHLLDGIII